MPIFCGPGRNESTSSAPRPSKIFGGATLLDSAQLLPLIPPETESLLDLGSGAGFPGLVLAVLGVRGVNLVESDARKCAFLQEAAPRHRY